MSLLDPCLRKWDYYGLLKSPGGGCFGKWVKGDGSCSMFPYHSLLRVVEALNELHRCTLACSTWADKGCCLSWLYCNTELIQDLRRIPVQRWLPQQNISTMDPPLRYLDFRPGWVVKGHIVKLNVSFDPVQLISSFRQTVDLGLLSAAFKNQTRIENASTFEICYTVVQLQQK